MRLGPLRAASAALLIAAATAAGAGAAASAGLPLNIYPPPVHSRGGALSSCPNPAGLEPVTRTATAKAVASASAYDKTSRALDLRASDTSWWPQVRSMWRTGRPELVNEVVDGTELLSRSDLSTIVAFSCGGSLVARSILVGVGPRQWHPPYCEACRTKLFFVDRRGRALLYYVY
jgi:hypothetical protein